MSFKKMVAVLSASVICVGAVTANAATFGQNIVKGDYPESAAETQKLIDNRPDIQRRMESLDRGVVAAKSGDHVFVSWRWLGTESLDVKYNLYRNGVKLNLEPLRGTSYTDLSPLDGAEYSVSAVVDGVEGEKSAPVSVWAEGYFDIPLQRPEEEYVVEDGEKNLPYSPSDVSVADLDGDGEYEYVVKWDPLYSKDAASAGYCGICVIDAYEMDGTLMWRINMGKNIRSGPHDTQFIVYDFDNDGKAEMACRTADGTIAGDGAVIGDKDADWAALNNGKNLQGPLYLTVFNGEDGSVMDTVDFYPQTVGTNPDGTKWDCTMFGDDYGNRSERYLAALGSFDGEHTGFIQARGYYDRSFFAAYHVENGKIVKEWEFDSGSYKQANGEINYLAGQGNHSMATADVDYDGCDEVIYGSLTVDHDGKAMYSTRLGHGDAQHVGDLLPSRPGLEVYSVHESTGVEYGYEMRDARTGEILFGENTKTDNGRGCTADIDPDYEGEECWSAAGVLTSADGTVISTNYSMPANYAIYWDGDLGREIQDGIEISKWNKAEMGVNAIFRAEGCKSINAAKSNPSLTADLFGDWREETIYPLKDGSALRIYTTTAPTNYRIPTLMHDTQYRNYVALQNVCYNQPTHLSYYLGYDTKTVPVPQMYTMKDGKEVKNPDLAKKSWTIDELYTGQTQELVIGCPTALINGQPVAIDENKAVVPYIDEADRTLVPLRFIAESFDAAVNYDDKTREIEIKIGDSTIKMNAGSSEYSVNGEAKTMDTKPVVENDRTMVPLRALSEALSKKIDYFSGLVIISDQALKEVNAPERIAQIKGAKPVEKPEYKGCYGRLTPLNITASADNDNIKFVNDSDIATSWTAKKGDSIVVELDGAPGIPAISIVFGDDKEHKMNVEVSGDGENWTMPLEEKVYTGKNDDYLKITFGVPPYKKYVRYTCLDEEGCTIREFAVLGVE